MTKQKHTQYHRINIMIRQDQYQRVSQAALNLSGLVRGLLDDHFSDEKIILSVSPKIKSIYQKLVSNLGTEDHELEPFLLTALDQYLDAKTDQIRQLRDTIK